MNESLMLKSCVVTLFVGLIALWLASRFIDDLMPVQSLNELDFKSSGYVKVRGTVAGVKNFGKYSVIDIVENKTVPVIVFRNVSYSGSTVEVIGQKSLFNGKGEIIADKVEFK